MRALVIDDDTITKVKQVIAYARSHVYYPGISESIPGDVAGHIVYINSYRCVFSFTKENGEAGRLYRHLSISIPSKDYPHPIAISAIAGVFEFTESERGVQQRVRDGAWSVGINKNEHCVVVVEELKNGQSDSAAH